MPIVLGKDVGLFYHVYPNHNWAIVLHCVNPRLDKCLLAFFMTVLYHIYTFLIMSAYYFWAKMFLDLIRIYLNRNMARLLSSG